MYPLAVCAQPLRCLELFATFGTHHIPVCLGDTPRFLLLFFEDYQHLVEPRQLIREFVSVDAKFSGEVVCSAHSTLLNTIWLLSRLSSGTNHAPSGNWSPISFGDRK